MANEQYIDSINRMNLLYFKMLGNFRGNEKHKEDNLHWLTGNITYNYFVGDVKANEIVRRMRAGEILKKLSCNAGDARS